MAIPKKFLIGGITTAGSIATATVVVVNQQRTTSVTPNTLTKKSKDLNKEPSVNVVKRVTTEQFLQQKIDSKPNQKAIQTWLKNNQKEKTWKIKIKKNESTDGFDYPNFTNDDLAGLSDYLTQKKSFLESLYSEKSIDFIFEKKEGTWRHIWIKGNIDSWVDKASSNKATLKIENMSVLKKEEEFESLYKFLESQKDLFTNLNGASQDNKKTILLTIVNSKWKRSKEEIKSWLKEQNSGNNKFTIKIQTSSEEQDLDQVNENNLVGLLGYLKTEENKNTLLKLVKDSTPLTFKKDNSWEVIHSDKTIENWVYNTSSGKVSLKLWKDYSEQNLSNSVFNQKEFTQLLNALKEKVDLFSDNLKNYSTTNKKTIVFEKYKLFNESEEQWKHIKDTIKELLGEADWVEDKIKIKGDSEILIKDTDDDKLTGLFKHLKDKYEEEIGEEDYEKLLDMSSLKELILRKKSGNSNQWEKVESKNIQK